MGNMDLGSVMNFKEKTIPAGWYQARILGGENVLSGKTGITGYQIRIELTDYQGEVNLKVFNDPIGYKLKTTIWHPDADKQGSEDKAEACARALRKFIKGFGVDASLVDENGFLDSKDFTGLEGMVKMKLTPDDVEEYKALKAAGNEDEFEGDFWAEVNFGGFKAIK